MKALVKFSTGKEGMELREVPVPSLKEDQVLVRIKAVGICGTDVKIMNDQFPYNPPVIVGHEFSGIIEQVGDGVRTWKPGDRVVAEQHFGACRRCFYCLTGKRHFCMSKTSPGYATDGAFADFIAVDASLLHRIPDTVSYREASLAEPMAVAAYGILGRGNVSAGDSVLILGCGPIALLAVQLVKAAGAEKVFITGLNTDERSRFRLARGLGADLTINVQKSDPLPVIQDHTHGLGADLVVDLSGSPEAILQGLSLIRKDGTFCALGLTSKKIAIPWTETALRAPRIIYSFSSDYVSWETCLGFLQTGRVIVRDFIDNIYSLDDWSEAFEEAERGDAVKIIIEP